MKKYLLTTISVLFLSAIFVTPIYSAGLNNPLGFDSIWGVIGAFLPVVAIVIGVALVGYLLYGAYMWMTAADKPDQLEGARKTLVNAVIGFALFGVGLGIFFFLSFVLGINWSDLFTGVGSNGGTGGGGGMTQEMCEEDCINTDPSNTGGYINGAGECICT